MSPRPARTVTTSPRRRVEDSGKSYLIYFTTCVLFSNFFTFLAIQRSGKAIFDPVRLDKVAKICPDGDNFVKTCPDGDNVAKTCPDSDNVAKTGGLKTQVKVTSLFYNLCSF